MFEAKPRAVEKKESSTETGVTAKSTAGCKRMFFYIYTYAYCRILCCIFGPVFCIPVIQMFSQLERHLLQITQSKKMHICPFSNVSFIKDIDCGLDLLLHHLYLFMFQSL